MTQEIKKPRIGRKKLVLLFMAIFIGTAQIGFYIPVDQDEAQSLYDTYMKDIKDLDAIGIGLHNLTIALAMCVPGFGLVFGVFTAVETGFAFHVANAVQQLPFEVSPALVLLITPFGIMEWIAYAIGMSRSYLLIRNIKNRQVLRSMLKPTIIEVSIVIALLIAGGFIEHAMIENATTLNYAFGK